MFGSDWSPLPMCQNFTNTSCCSGGNCGDYYPGAISLDQFTCTHFKMEPWSLLWVPGLFYGYLIFKWVAEIRKYWRVSSNRSSGRIIIFPFCTARNNNDSTRKVSIVKTYTRLFALINVINFDNELFKHYNKSDFMHFFRMHAICIAACFNQYS